ncbi:MAG TPA: protein kinase [Flexivirga sp.]|uniref:protein kinase domain-containing protein n=1 Tax=Flexivirga sp. TaxID=1962927 RepID=UPI002CB32F7E|nr:protein kinase [Flexivirga sp.]HWC24188.1 protein kinase [Flexivirga sp.]
MSNQPPAPGKFGPYEILGLIGRGGMGEVYRARDSRKGRIIALKLLPKSLSSDPRFRARFGREAHIAANLNDPHVVPIHDYGEIDGVLYIEMALVEGSDLRARLKAGAMPPHETADLVGAIGSALDTAHAQGLLHRDVKPENILVTERGFPYLTDFGIAAQQDETRLTSTGTAVGSMSYMAPERFDDGELTPAVDEYAMACVMYECLTGRRPFDMTTTSAMIRAHLMSQPASLQHTGLPPAVDAVVRRGLAKDPGLRFGSCAELGHALREALAGRVDQATTHVANLMQHQGDPTRAASTAPTSGVDTRSDTHSRETQLAHPAAAAGAGGWGGPANAHQSPPSGSSGTGKSKLPAILGAVAGVLVIALVAGYFLFSRDDSKKDAAGPSAGAGQSTAAGKATPTQETTPAEAQSSTPEAATSTAGGTTPGGAETDDSAPGKVTQSLADLEASSSSAPKVDDITIGGKPYAGALVADSCGYDTGSTKSQTFSWSLDGKWETLSGFAGIPDDGEEGSAGSVQIYGDQTLLWPSGDMKLRDAPTKIPNISVKGRSSLIIKFTTKEVDICGSAIALGDAKLTGKNGVAPAPTAS